MITKNMIEAGEKAYEDSFFHSTNGIASCDKMVAAVYEAMSDQKQKDALADAKQAGKDFYDRNAHLVEESEFAQRVDRDYWFPK